MTTTEIKKALADRNITRLNLAERIGCSYSYLCQMLNGYSGLKEKYAEKIEAALRDLQ